MNTTNLHEIDAQGFDDAIAQPGIVLVDFWAPWCGPCRAFAPVFERAAARNPDVTFAKVNTEEQSELAAEFDIQSIPTLMVIREGVVLYNRAGMLPPAALDKLIESARAVDMAAVKKSLARQNPA